MITHKEIEDKAESHCYIDFMPMVDITPTITLDNAQDAYIAGFKEQNEMFIQWLKKYEEFYKSQWLVHGNHSDSVALTLVNEAINKFTIS